VRGYATLFFQAALHQHIKLSEHGLIHHFEWLLHLLSIDEIYLAGDKMRLAVRNAVGGLTA
jgi:hypothetical protein